MTLRITTEDRRNRLVERHNLGASASTVEEAVAGVVAIHSSDPTSPYLACRARVGGFSISALDRALFEERSLWRLHAMRRTLFVVSTDDAPIFVAGCGRTIAERERARLQQLLGTEMGSSASGKLIARLETAVLEALAGGGEIGTADLGAAIPGLKREITVGSGKWAGRVPLSSRLLYTMAMEGKIVRARPAGSWRSSQYQWALTADWFSGTASRTLKRVDGQAGLLSRYLAAYGPATLTDIRWWTGWTARDSRAAIEAAGADPVELDDGTGAFVAKGDFDSPADNRDSVALLPGLDSTPMGWKERSWYLGDHAGPLFDRNGNIGPTVWLGGRIVGGWGQRPDGRIAYRLLEDTGTEPARRIAAEAEDLTAWLNGTIVTPRFQAPLGRELSA